MGKLFHQYLTGKLPEFDTKEYDYAFEAVLDDQKLQVSPDLPDKIQSMLNGMMEGDPEKDYQWIWFIRCLMERKKEKSC